MNLRKFRNQAFLGVFVLLGNSCQQEPKKVDDPVSSLNALVKEYGHIGYVNPLDESGPGTMLAGTPKELAFVAHAEDCFPSENIARHEDTQHFSKKHSYIFQGGFGFLANANSLFSAGASLTNNIYVNIEMTNMTMEYMSSIDITDWYQNGMSQTCRDYLDDVGFVIQALKSENLVISLETKEGTTVGLSLDNINEYIDFGFDVEYEIVDGYKVEITTPKYIGYQLGRLRLDDDGRSLYRASTAEENKFVFKRIALFDDPAPADENESEEETTGDTDDDNIYIK